MGRHQHSWLRLAVWGLVTCLMSMVRSAVADTGTRSPRLVIAGGYTAELAANALGGLERSGTYLDNMDLTLRLDSSERWAARLTLFAYGLGNQGGAPSQLVGTTQGVSNIEAPTTWKIFELWAEAAFLSERLRIRGGLYDLNSEFDVIDTAQLFINPSHGMGPEYAQSGRNGPSIFPTTSLGLRGMAIVESFYFRAAALDGVAGDPADPSGTRVILDRDDGLLVAIEAGYQGDDGPLRNVAIGAWGYSADFDDVTETDDTGRPVRRAGNAGAYGFADARVLGEDEGRGLSVFGRLGVADSDVNRTGFYLGTGLVYTGIIPQRGEDRLGFAMAAAIATSKLRDVTGDRGETVLELSYLAPLHSLALQPDVQLFLGPGDMGQRRYALAVLLRAVLAFETSLDLVHEG